MSTPTNVIQARVLSCVWCDMYSDGYRYELWIETPHGAWLGKGASEDCPKSYPVGSIVNCELVEIAKPPDFDGKKNDCTNFYRVL